MRYKLFGNSSLRISELCLGTMNFGGDEQWGIDKIKSQEIFEAFANSGGNYIDTANIYTQGKSESYLADFLNSERDQFVLGTKYSLLADPKSVNGFGNSRKHLLNSIDASLKALDTDYIDIFWVHSWDYITRAEEIVLENLSL